MRQLRGAGDGAQQVWKCERFDDVIVEAGGEYRFAVGIGCECGQRDRQTMETIFRRSTDGAQQFIAVHPWHGEIADEHVKGLCPPLLESLAAGRRLRDSSASTCKCLRGNLA